MPLTTNVRKDLRHCVQNRLRDNGIDEVYVQDTPITEEQLSPGVYVSLPQKGPAETYRNTCSSERTHLGYRIQVTSVSGSIGAFNESDDDTPDIRQLCRRLFNDKRLDFTDGEMSDTGVVELGCTVEHGEFDAADKDKDLSNWDITVMIVTCWVGETRTV